MLRLLEFSPGLGNGEESDPIDLGKPLSRAEVGRPFQLKSVAAMNLIFFPIAAEGPSVNDLSSSLLDRPKGSKLSGWFGARFFLELTDRSGQQFLARVGFAFGNAPMAAILSGKERPAGVREKHFKLPVAEPIHEESRADSGFASPSRLRMVIHRIELPVVAAMGQSRTPAFAGKQFISPLGARSRVSTVPSM